MTQAVIFAIVAVISLAISSITNYRYLAGRMDGCLALPLQVLATAFCIFFAVSFMLWRASFDPFWMCGWRVIGAIAIGIGSGVGMHRARSIVKSRQRVA